MISRKEMKIGLISLIALALLLNFAAAAGVTAPYWDGYPMSISPGETKDVQFGLQNLVGDNNVTFRASVITGADIAQITDSNSDYLVPLGHKDVYVNMKISIPKSAQAGSKYRVGVSFSSITSGSGGQLTLANAYDTYFDVIVNSNQSNNSTSQSSSPKAIYWIAGILVVLAVISLVIRNRKIKE